MTKPQLTPPKGILVAIDVAKARNEVLIEVPGLRRRRLSVLNSSLQRGWVVAPGSPKRRAGTADDSSGVMATGTNTGACSSLPGLASPREQQALTIPLRRATEQTYTPASYEALTIRALSSND